MERSPSMLPTISIVTPSLNQGDYLEKTILSVLNQNYPKLEYIIIDGGSTDQSVAIIKKYEKYLKYWVSEPDRGQSHAINKGFEHVTGDLLAWLNSDDYYMDGALQAVAELFLESKGAGAFVGAGQMVDSAGRIICYKEPEEVTLEGLFRWPVQGLFMQPSCFFAREVWKKCGPVDETLHFTMDVDLWLKIAKEARYARCNHLLSTSLIHKDAKTTVSQNRTAVDLAFVLMRHGGEKEARQILDDMERRLSYAEPNFYQILRHPLFRLAQPVIRLFAKPAVKWSTIYKSASNHGHQN